MRARHTHSVDVGGETSKGSRSERLARGLTALALIVPPLLVWPALADPFHLPKLVASELLGLASAIALVVAMRSRLPLPWRLPALRATVPLLVVAVASVGFSTHGEHGRQALGSLSVALVCLWAWSLFGQRLRRLLDVLLVPAVVLSVVAVLQFHGLFRPFAFLAGEEENRFGVTSLAGSVGDLGAFLVLPCLLAQLAVLRALRAHGTARLRRLPVMVAIAIVLHYGLVVSQTFTALAALALGTVMLWLTLLPARRWWVVAAGGVLLLATVAAAPPLRERVARLMRNASGGRWAAVLSGRTDGWKAAVWMFREHPLLGVGLGGYLPAFTPAKLALLERGESFFLNHAGRSTFRNAHNELLELLSEMGLAGILALAWGVWVFVGSLRRRARDALEEAGGRPDLALAFAGLAALLVLAFSYFPFRLALTAYPAVAFLAWTFGPETEAAGSVPRRRYLPPWVAWVVAVLIAGSLYLCWRRAERRIEASQIVRAVELIDSAMGESGRVNRSLLYGQIRALKKARPLAPAEVSIPLGIGGQYLMLGQAEEARQWFERALELEPRPEIYAALGGAQALAGRADEAQANRATAARLDPRTYGSP